MLCEGRRHIILNLNNHVAFSNLSNLSLKSLNFLCEMRQTEHKP